MATLPNAETIRADYAVQPNTKTLAARYGVPYTTLRNHLVELGLFSSLRKGERTLLIDKSRDDRITVGRLVSASEYGGTVRKPFSLPRVAMHIAALEERRP